MFLDNLAIRTKALIPVVVMALTVLTIVVIGGAQLSSFSAAANDMIDRRDRGLVAILKAARDVDRLRLTVFQSLMYDDMDSSENDRESQTFDEAYARADDRLAVAARLLPKHESEINQLSKRFDDMVESAKSPFKIGQETPGLAAGRSREPAELDKLAEGARQLYEVDKTSTKLINDMTALSNGLSAENDSLAQDLQARGRSGIVWLATVGFAATLIAVVLSFCSLLTE